MSTLFQWDVANGKLIWPDGFDDAKKERFIAFIKKQYAEENIEFIQLLEHCNKSKSETDLASLIQYISNDIINTKNPPELKEALGKAQRISEKLEILNLNALDVVQNINDVLNYFPKDESEISQPSSSPRSLSQRTSSLASSVSNKFEGMLSKTSSIASSIDTLASSFDTSEVKKTFTAKFKSLTAANASKKSTPSKPSVKNLSKSAPAKRRDVPYLDQAAMQKINANLKKYEPSLKGKLGILESATRLYSQYHGQRKKVFSALDSIKSSMKPEDFNQFLKDYAKGNKYTTSLVRQYAEERNRASSRQHPKKRM